MAYQTLWLLQDPEQEPVHLDILQGVEARGTRPRADGEV